MKILHYAIGIPPVRRGGMVQYVLDLMDEQVRAGGHQVALLYPGVSCIWPRSWIRQQSTALGIRLYEIVNASDVAVTDGVARPDRILHPRCNLANTAIEHLLNQEQPDILHIHSFMGIPPYLLKAARQRGIRIVYTTHDYYGLCYTLHFIDAAGKRCYGAEAKKCAECCRGAPGPWALYLRSQPSIYALRSLINRIKPFFSGWFKKQIPSHGTTNVQGNWANYAALTQYYGNLFAQVDIFHFNSHVSEGVFKSVLDVKTSKVLGVTNSQVVDKRARMHLDPQCVRIGFMGGTVSAKGLSVLLDAGRTLLRQNVRNWKMVFWGLGKSPDLPASHVELGKDFSRAEVHQVYASLDLLVVPSLWPETFGLVVLEALSVGVPVLVSDQVGAQDVIARIDPSFIYKGGQEVLAHRLAELLGDVAQLEECNRKILAMPFSFDMGLHAQEMDRLYRDGK